MSVRTYDKMSESELIATILGKPGPDGECVRLARFITEESTTPTDQFGINLVKGVAAAKRLVKIEASVELGRRLVASRRVREATRLATSDDVVALMEPVYLGLKREVFYCLALTSKNDLIKMVEVSIGSLNSTIVHPRELYREAVKLSAACVIICHNHPSGDPLPSRADIDLTHRLIRAGEVIGIELLDHVVMGGEGRHVSMREDKLI